MGGTSAGKVVGGMITDSELWREFRGEFQALADEQRTIVTSARQGDRRLRAYSGYNSDITAIESEMVQQGLVCLLYRTESGDWQLGTGPNEDLKARFEALATRAGLKLRVPPGMSGRDFWLHNLSLHLRRTGSEKVFRRAATDAPKS